MVGVGITPTIRREGGTMGEPTWTETPQTTTDEVAGWIELPESGWGALVGWAAGGSRLRRVPDHPGAHATVVSTGDGRSWTQPRSGAEQAGVDADIAGYLADAGVAARPAGYRWYLRPPTRATDPDEFWARVNDGVERLAPGAAHPAELRPILELVLAEIYEG
jgi:hypothetical protein